MLDQTLFGTLGLKAEKSKLCIDTVDVKFEDVGVPPIFRMEVNPHKFVGRECTAANKRNVCI